MTLTRVDKCDACHSAQAFLKVGKPVELFGGIEIAELQFCVHHFNKHEEYLLGKGWEIVADTRDTLNVRPSISANAE